VAAFFPRRAETAGLVARKIEYLKKKETVARMFLSPILPDDLIVRLVPGYSFPVFRRSLREIGDQILFERAIFWR
jgi:hypothetical protein